MPSAFKPTLTSALACAVAAPLLPQRVGASTICTTATVAAIAPVGTTITSATTQSSVRHCLLLLGAGVRSRVVRP